MTTNVVRLDRLQRGLTLALRAVHPTATVVWAPSEFPRAAAGSLVFACRLLAGPDTDPIGGDSRRRATLPTRLTIRILAATASNSILILLSGRRFEVATTGDIETTRDALLAELTDEYAMVDATFTADDVDGIIVEALELGDLYDVAAHASATGLVSLTVDETQACEVQTADVRSYVEIQAFGASRSPRTGAAWALNRFRGRIGLPSVADILEEHGLGLIGAPGRVTTLDALAGPTWQTRSALSVWIAQVSLAAELGPTIDTVRGNVYARGAGAPIQVPIETEPEP